MTKKLYLVMQCKFFKDAFMRPDTGQIVNVDTKALGYLPIYESREVAEREHPGAKILECEGDDQVTYQVPSTALQIWEKVLEHPGTPATAKRPRRPRRPPSPYDGVDPD